METLTARELRDLVGSVFPRGDGDRHLMIMVDVPRLERDDNPDWVQRRRLAWEWAQALRPELSSLGLDALYFVAYPDVGSNNADLPATAFVLDSAPPPRADALQASGTAKPFDALFDEVQLILSPTEYSTTAPLKNAARRFGFRAATMPGFTPLMIPALRLDYDEVSRRVRLIKEKLDPALRARVQFKVDQIHALPITFDLRFRLAHLSPGQLPDPGTAGNVPSGETYIVPYEGEQEGEESQTEGLLPVQIKDQVVVFEIKHNRAMAATPLPGEALTDTVRAEQEHLRREPAYGNMAELGFGVLSDFGLSPIGELLLDEKLGFHVAFGRSDHFGGIVGPKDFSSPAEVIHLDQIYIRATQPRVQLVSVDLEYPDGSQERLIQDWEYTVF